MLLSVILIKIDWNLALEIKKLQFAAGNRSLEDPNKTRNGKSQHKLFRKNGYKKFSTKNICGSCKLFRCDFHKYLDYRNDTTYSHI